MSMHRRFVPSALALTLSVLSIVSARHAAAGTTCGSNADCPKGFTCQAGAPTACPAIACAPNQPCNPPPCNPTVTHECAPGPCSTDADCAAGMVCFAQTETSCPTVAAPACAPGQTCPTPAPTEAGACVTTTTNSCVPRYLLPCQADSDCGGGFTCLADQACACAGSGSAPAGSASSPAGSAPPSPPGGQPPPTVDAGDPQCSCTTLSTSHCQAEPIVCTSAGDCPSMWSCTAPSTAVACSGGASIDGSMLPTVCTPVGPTVPSTCTPPYADLAASFGGAKGSGELAGGAPPAAPQAGADNASPTGTSHSTAHSSSGGCQLGASRAGAGDALWLGLLGVLGLGRRRRRP